MRRSGLRRNDEGEQAGRFLRYFILPPKDQHEREWMFQLKDIQDTIALFRSGTWRNIARSNDILCRAAPKA